MSRWIGALAAAAGATLAATLWVRRLFLFKAFRVARKVLPTRSLLHGVKYLAKR
jgi:hypothetical protein